jgi:hypothetical protein
VWELQAWLQANSWQVQWLSVCLKLPAAVSIFTDGLVDENSQGPKTMGCIFIDSQKPKNLMGDLNSYPLSYKARK